MHFRIRLNFNPLKMIPVTNFWCLSILVQKCITIIEIYLSSAVLLKSLGFFSMEQFIYIAK